MNRLILSASLLFIIIPGVATCSQVAAAVRTDKPTVLTMAPAALPETPVVATSKKASDVAVMASPSTSISQSASFQSTPLPKPFQITNTTDSSIFVELGNERSSVSVKVLAHSTQWFEGAKSICMSSPIPSSLQPGAELKRSYCTNIPSHHFFLVLRADGTVDAVTR